MLTSPSYSAMVARPKCNQLEGGIVGGGQLLGPVAPSGGLRTVSRKKAECSDVHAERRIVDLHCARQRLDRTGQPGQVAAVEPDQCGRSTRLLAAAISPIRFRWR